MVRQRVHHLAPKRFVNAFQLHLAINLRRVDACSLRLSSASARQRSHVHANGSNSPIDCYRFLRRAGRNGRERSGGIDDARCTSPRAAVHSLPLSPLALASSTLQIGFRSLATYIYERFLTLSLCLKILVILFIAMAAARLVA